MCTNKHFNCRNINKNRFKTHKCIWIFIIIFLRRKLMIRGKMKSRYFYLSIVMLVSCLGFNMRSNNVQAKDTSIKHYGKIERYGLPKGAPWMHVYVNGKETKETLNNNEFTGMRLGEKDKISFGSNLPLVGTVTTKALEVGKYSQEPMLDQEGTFDKIYAPLTMPEHVEERNLSISKTSKLPKQGFSDVQKYLEAVNSNDPSKLPSQQELLVAGIELNKNIPVSYTYELKELYFNKKDASLQDSPIYVDYKIEPDKGYVAILHNRVYAKVKKTEAKENPQLDVVSEMNGETKPNRSYTVIESFDLQYYLVDDHWELYSVTDLEYSRHSLKNKKDYIIKKVN